VGSFTERTMNTHTGFGTSGRTLTGLALGAGLLMLSAGTPRASASEPPPAPPTLSDCWREFIQQLMGCRENFGVIPGFDSPIYRACVEAVRWAFEQCLRDVQPPQPSPSITSCYLRLLQALEECKFTFPDPCFPNPDPPGGCTTDPSVNWAKQECIKAAQLEFKKCRGFVPRPPFGPQGTLSVAPDRVRVEPLGKYLNVMLSIEPFGVEDWSHVEVIYGHVHPADPNNPEATILIPGGSLTPANTPDLGKQPVSVTLNIPAEVYEHGQSLVGVIFNLWGAGQQGPSHADVLVLQVMYSQHDLNRDGRVDNDDVLIALTRYFNGEFTWAQYQAVLRAAER
jgi:hypothetical protein